MVIGISNNQGFCGSLTRYVVGAGLATLAYLVGGPALATIGSIGYMWMTSSNNRRALEGVERVAVRDRELMNTPPSLEAVERDELGNYEVMTAPSTMEDVERVVSVRDLMLINLTLDLEGVESDVLRDYEVMDVLFNIEPDRISEVPVGDREEVIRLASSLITQGMGAHERGSLIEAVAKVPVDDRKQVLRLASSLITQGMGAQERGSLIEGVARVPVDDRKQVIALVSPLITQDMNGWQIRELIGAVTGRTFALFKTCVEIPVSDREEVIRLASSLITQGMGAHERGSLIEAVAKVPASDREQLIALVSPLITQDMTLKERSLLIGAVLEIPVSDREEVIRLASFLITQGMGANERGSLIEAVAKVPASDREQVIALVSPLISQDMTARDIEYLIEAIARVPVSDREEVIRLASRFIAQNILDSRDAVRFFAQMEVGRGQFCDLAILLTQDIPRDNFNDKRLICRALWTIGPVERAERAQRALDQIPQDLLNGLENEEMPLRIATILETPLHQLIPPLRARMAELFEAGHNAVDVHHDGRDASTRKAVELLQKRQGQLSEEVISNGVKEFKQFLNAFENSDLKAKAQQALEGQDPQEVWPPLLKNNNTHAIDGGRLLISGEELIARLWLYANQHPEKENCQISMIKALADSIEEGKRVCPPGQTQRLVVGVLQGRLEGANVDKVEAPTITLNQSVAAFLSENQTCPSRAQLMTNAEVFLNTNPLVNREAFLGEINYFANSMGMH